MVRSISHRASWIAGAMLAVAHVTGHAAIGLPADAPVTSPSPPKSDKPASTGDFARRGESAAIDGTVRFGMHMGEQTAIVPDICFPMLWSRRLYTGFCYQGRVLLRSPANDGSSGLKTATSLDTSDFKLNVLSRLWRRGNWEFSSGALYGFQSISHDMTEQTLLASGESQLVVTSDVDFQVHHVGLSSFAGYRRGRLSLRGVGEMTYGMLTGSQRITMRPEVPVRVSDDALGRQHGLFYRIKGGVGYRTRSIFDFTVKSLYQKAPAPYNTISASYVDSELGLVVQRVPASITRAEVVVGAVMKRISSFNLHPFLEMGFHRDVAKEANSGDSYTNQGMVFSLGLTSAI